MSLITALRMEGQHKDNFIDPLARQLKTFYDLSFKVFTGTTDEGRFFSFKTKPSPQKLHSRQLSFNSSKILSISTYKLEEFCHIKSEKGCPRKLAPT